MAQQQSRMTTPCDNDKDDSVDEYSTMFHQITSDPVQYLGLKKIKKIGEGGEAAVYLMQRITNPDQEVVVKMFSWVRKSWSDPTWESFVAESNVLQTIRHENIAEMFCPIASPSYGIILMEYYKGGALSTHLHHLKNYQVYRYFGQVLSALQHLHSKRYIHRDIKPDNVLVNNDRAYLSDFGLSKVVPNENGLVSGFVGTQRYMAPEVFQSDVPYNGFKADMFSLGVLLWCLLMKDEPDQDMDLWLPLADQLTHHKPNIRLVHLLKALIKQDPNGRPGINSVIEVNMDDFNRNAGDPGQ